MAHELARGEHAGREGPVDDGVETGLEQADQVVAGDALHPRRSLVVVAELTLADVVLVAQPLLLEQLPPVVALSPPPLQAVHSGGWPFFSMYREALDVSGMPSLRESLTLGPLNFNSGSPMCCDGRGFALRETADPAVPALLRSPTPPVDRRRAPFRRQGSGV